MKMNVSCIVAYNSNYSCLNALKCHGLDERRNWYSSDHCWRRGRFAKLYQRDVPSLSSSWWHPHHNQICVVSSIPHNIHIQLCWQQYIISWNHKKTQFANCKAMNVLLWCQFCVKCSILSHKYYYFKQNNTYKLCFKMYKLSLICTNNHQ